MTHFNRNRYGAYDAASWVVAEAEQQTACAVPMPQHPPPEVYSLREVAEIFGRTERTIRNWVRAGHLQRGGFGNAIFFSRAAIDALLNGGGNS